MQKIYKYNVLFLASKRLKITKINLPSRHMMSPRATTLINHDSLNCPLNKSDFVS